MATRNERKRNAIAKAKAFQSAIDAMQAQQAERLRQRDLMFQRLAEYPIQYSGQSVVKRTSDYRGKIASNGGKRKFVATAQPIVIEPTKDETVPFGQRRRYWSK